LPTWFGSGRFSNDVKIANYRAVNGEIVLVDTTAGGWTLSPPLSPEINTSFGFHIVAQSPNLLTIDGDGVDLEVGINKQASSITCPGEKGFSIFWAFHPNDWSIVYTGNKRDVRLPVGVLRSDSFTPDFVVGTSFADTGLEIVIDVDGVYDVRVILRETIDFQGNQDMKFTIRATEDGVPLADTILNCNSVGTSGVVEDIRNFSFYRNLIAATYKIQAVRVSAGILTILDTSTIQIVGPLSL